MLLWLIQSLRFFFLVRTMWEYYSGSSASLGTTRLVINTEVQELTVNAYWYEVVTSRFSPSTPPRVRSARSLPQTEGALGNRKITSRRMSKRRRKLVACKVERKFQLFYASSLLTVTYVVCRNTTPFRWCVSRQAVRITARNIFYRINSLLPFLIIDGRLMR